MFAADDIPDDEADVPPSLRGRRSLLPRPGGREHSVVRTVGRDWWAHARVREQRGRLVVMYFETWPRKGRDPRGGLSGNALRGLRLDLAGVAVAAEDMSLRSAANVSLLKRTARERIETREARELRLLARKRQGKGRGEDFYARVAADYLRAVKDHPHRPVVALREAYRDAGMRDVTTERVRSWVNLARSERYGFLRPGKAGFAEAVATKKLERWLERRER